MGFTITKFMPVIEYSLKRDGEKLCPGTQHFKVKEFACHDGSDLIKIDDQLPVLLEMVREYCAQNYGRCSIKITSGYRTPAHNAAEHGATSSQHVKGTAADFQVILLDENGKPIMIEVVVNGKKVKKPKQVPAHEVHDAIDEMHVFGPHNGGLGRYATWTHLDVRKGKARWKVS